MLKETDVNSFSLLKQLVGSLASLGVCAVLVGLEQLAFFFLTCLTTTLLESDFEENNLDH